MKLAIVTAYPNSKVTLSEYGYHLVKHFRHHPEISELIVLTDAKGAQNPELREEDGCPVQVVESWAFNDLRNLWRIQRAISQTKPDAVLYNLQFLKFGDRKVPAALGLLSPMITKLRGIPTISL